ncbi:hypothetical protein JCM3766R1_004028 [Sporobolomyces carnicolor]
MWSAVARLTSPAPRRSSTTAFRADEPTFVRLYDSLRATLLAAPTPATADASPVVVQNVRLELSQLLAILRVESAAKEDGMLGPCIDYALREATFRTLVELVEKDEPAGVRLELVRWFGRAIVELDEGFLAQNGVNKPLIKLLRCCVEQQGGMSRDEELSVVETMCNVCERIKSRPELLVIFLRHSPPTNRKDMSSPPLASSGTRPPPFTRISSAGDSDGRPASPAMSQMSASDDVSTSFSMSNASSSQSRRQRSERDFILFAYLLRFIHREGRVGELARQGILALCDVALGYPDVYSPSFPSPNLPRSTSDATITPSVSSVPLHNASTREAVLAFAEYLLDSDFAEVLGAGLGALYGLLPSKLVVRKASTGGQAGEVVDGVVSKNAGGMQLGGMGPLGEEEDAEDLERKREEEEDRLRSLGVGLSGTPEVRDGLDSFLNLVEFAQDVLTRCAPPPLIEQTDHEDEGTAVEESDENRQRALLLSALTDSILTAVRELFLRSVLYPSILECSEADGSAVAVLSYLEAVLDVVNDATKLESAVLGFLFGEEEAAHKESQPSGSLARPPNPIRSVRSRKSSALLLIEKTANSHRHPSSSYFTSLGRFSLKDLLASHLTSTSQSTATSALKLLQTILSKHDRWSLALLDVVLDEGATSFPLALRELDEGDVSVAGLSRIRHPTESKPTNGLLDEEEEEDESDEEFVYPISDQRETPELSGTGPSRPMSLQTPRKATGSELGRLLPSTPSVMLHLDHLDTLLSLISSIDPAYRDRESTGGKSQMLSSGFDNYLRDAETSLAADQGFRRGVLVDPTIEPDTLPLHHQYPRKRTSLFASGPAVRASDFASAATGRRHRIKPQGELVGLLLESFSHFFSHSPDVNLALTSVISTLATYPYRSLEGWLLPVVRQKRTSIERDGSLSTRSADAALSDDGDDRSVDFQFEERSRQHSLLSSPLPSTARPFDLSNPPPSATRAAMAQSDSLLSIIGGLVESIEQYRAKVPKFDQYLSERRKGLFFVENLADALHLDDLVSSSDQNDSSFSFSSSSPEPPLPLPLPSTPIAKPKAGGLAAFFSPRRPSHNRSPSTPLNKSFSTPEHAHAAKPLLRRTASNDSISHQLAVPASRASGTPAARSKTATGPASPFVAHYRQTGSIAVEPVVVSTPGTRHRSARRGVASELDENDEEDEEAEEEEDSIRGERVDPHVVPDSPSRRLSPLPTPVPKTASSGNSTLKTHTRPGPPSSSSFAARSGKPLTTVTLSTILDNVILLEEFVKELSAIIFVRREVGIDSVRFVAY